MLESALEQFLLQFFTPYVEGISKDSLHLGVLGGSLELKNVHVKPDALALLGLEGFRVRVGTIGLLRLSVPWSKLSTGKLRASIQGLQLQVEHLTESWSAERKVSEFMKEVREMKRSAIDVRVAQLRDLLEQQRQFGAGGDAGLAAKLLRKMLNNIHITFSDTHVVFSSGRHRLECGFHLPELQVVSTDQTFRERPDNVEVPLSRSICKLLRVQGFGVTVSRGGSSVVSARDCADYILSPMDASIKLAHIPNDQLLRLHLEAATAEIAELSITRTQLRTLRAAWEASSEEAERLRRLMVPPQAERKILVDPEGAGAEYGRLYERSLFQERGLADKNDRPLSPDEVLRMQLLEDALSVRLLGRERQRANGKAEDARRELARRISDIERARAIEEQRRAGLLRQLVAPSIASNDRDRTSEDPTLGKGLNSPKSAVWLLTDEEQKLRRDLDDESKLESVDLPQRLRLEFSLGKIALDFIDDRWPDGARRRLLSLGLQDAEVAVDVVSIDKRGQDLAEWRVDCRLRAFRALHTGRVVIRLHAPQLMGTDFADDEDATSGEEPVREQQDVTRFSIGNKLDEGQNLLFVESKLAPAEVHILPGALDQLIVFFAAPPPPAPFAWATGTREEICNVKDANVDNNDPILICSDGIEIASGQESSDAAESGQICQAKSGDCDPSFSRADIAVDIDGGQESFIAKEVAELAELVGVQIPDRVRLDLRLSVVIRVPIEGLGSSTVNVGQLEVTTPDPCEWNALRLAVRVSQLALRGTSAKGESFSLLQPTSAQLMVCYMSSNEESTLDVEMDLAHATVTLAPHSLRLLTATPAAFANGLFASEMKPETAEEDLSPTGSSRVPPDGYEDGRIGQFRLNVAVRIGALDVILTDSITHLATVRLEAPEPGVRLYWQRLPHMLSADLDNGAIGVSVFDVHKRVWEPMVERLDFAVEATHTPEGSSNSHATHVIASGLSPLNINVTSFMVQTFSDLLPCFAQETSQAAEDDIPGTVESQASYRVMNLCDHPIELEFVSRHRRGLVLQVQPTGSRCESLDDWILPHFATAVLARVPGAAFSEPVLLERGSDVVAAVPESGGAFAEMFSPGAGQRMLLLASRLRIHNRTDMAVAVRFHDAVQREVLMADVSSNAVCDASLLGFDLPQGETRSDRIVAPSSPSGPAQLQLPRSRLESAVSDSVCLPPNAICSVPSIAFQRNSAAVVTNDGGPVIDSPVACISVRPTGLEADFCLPVSVGLCAPPRTVRCYTRDAPSGSGDLHFLIMPEASANQSLVSLVIKPPLTLINAIPICGIEVSCAERGHTLASQTTALVPRLTRMNLYSFPGVPCDGLLLQARFHELVDAELDGAPAGTGGSPWSRTIGFGRSHSAGCSGNGVKTVHGVEEVEDGVCELQMQGSVDCASSTVVVETIGPSVLRLSCPHIFVDRSGLSRPLAVVVQSEDRALPSKYGLTMLPGVGFEDGCDLVLRSNFSTFASQKVRMPPNWMHMPWRTQCGTFVFCLQTDDISSIDVFGARCQTTTLRPRLVLTNESTQELEFRVSGGKLMRLGADQSLEAHWNISSGDEDEPGTSLRFRPLCNPPCEWSGIVDCTDAAAGATPFTIRPSDGSDGDNAVWNVVVTPSRGALAVMFREGSNFVAINRTLHSKLTMMVRPLSRRRIGDGISKGSCSTTEIDGKSAAGSLDFVVPTGTEKPYGWWEVASGTQDRAVDVFVGGLRIHFHDVRQTMRRRLRTIGVQILLERAGPRTLLVLEDLRRSSVDADNASGVQAGMSWIKHVEIKLGRVSLSLIDSAPRPRELFYVAADLARFDWRQSDEDLDTQELRGVLSDFQIDCQLPGRVDGRSPQSQEGSETAIARGFMTSQERPAVILVNRGVGVRPFLSLFVRRAAASAPDVLLLQHVDIKIDPLDVSIDDEWLQALMNFIQASISTRSAKTTSDGVPLASVLARAGQPIAVGYGPPPLPPLMQVDSMEVSGIQLAVWCRLGLKRARFLPPYVRTALRVLSLSGQLTLDGATLVLAPRRMSPQRGSLADLARGVGNAYLMALLQNAGTLLGKSSVMNVPRVPLKVGGMTVSYLSDSIGFAAGEAASLLGELTFDREFVAQQRRIRSNKEIKSLGDGVTEAGKALVQGAEGLMDVARKPAEGAKHGIGGIFVGVGRGVAGGLVKPISKLGQAISDVGSGIAAQVGPESASQRRYRARCRQRQPRLLFSALGAIRPWSELEAEVLAQLGSDTTRGVEEVIPLTQHTSQCTLLLLFAHRMLVADIFMPGVGPSGDDSGGSRRGLRAVDGRGRSSSSSAARGPAPSGAAPPPRRVPPRGMDFAALHAVIAGDEDFLLQLEDFQGARVDLPLFASPLSAAARRALAEGFESAALSGGTASWEHFRSVLHSESRRMEESPCSGRASAGATAASAGERAMEVWEVERRLLGQAWRTPFLPTDVELSWRWVDACGRRHPFLAPELSREDAAARTTPPVLPGTLLRSRSEWTLSRPPGTDAGGWRYAVAWATSTWDPEPGLLNVLRRRRWTQRCG